MYSLRPYQKICVDTLWNAMGSSDSVLCVMATGLGKTECFIELARRAGVPTAVLVGRDKLVEQTARRMRRVIDDVGVWSAGQGEKRIARTTVVSIHSADELNIQGLRFVICDEAHNLNDGRYASFLSRHRGVKLAGFTATPWRANIPIYGAGKRFESITYKRGILEGIKDGYLVRPVTKSMPVAFDTKGLKVRGGDFILSEVGKLVADRPKVKAQVEDAISRLSERKKIVWICTNIEHAEMVASIIPENIALVHSKNPHNDYAMECFERGDVRHLVSVMMLTEGYDHPAIDSIVMMRPTKSVTLYVQAIGRGLRPYEGKSDCLVLDYGEVVANCGPLNDPYLKEERQKKEKLETVMRTCPKCLSYFQGAECPDCGHVEVHVRDALKALQAKAAEVNMLAEPMEFECDSVGASKYKSKNGNDCIKLSFKLKNSWKPVHMYGSNHPYSWGKIKRIIEDLTPFQFNSWKECYDACESLVFETPEKVRIEQKNGYDTITRVYSRASDT